MTPYGGDGAGAPLGAARGGGIPGSVAGRPKGDVPAPFRPVAPDRPLRPDCLGSPSRQYRDEGPARRKDGAPRHQPCLGGRTEHASRQWGSLLQEDPRRSVLAAEGRAGAEAGRPAGHLRQEQGADHRHAAPGEEVAHPRLTVYPRVRCLPGAPGVSRGSDGRG